MMVHILHLKMLPSNLEHIEFDWMYNEIEWNYIDKKISQNILK